MRFPQVSDRVKEAPAQALRGVFAGIGQILLITDKIRNKAPVGQRVPQARVPQLSETVPDTGPPVLDTGPPAGYAAPPEPEPEPEPRLEPRPEPEPELATDTPAPATRVTEARDLDRTGNVRLLTSEEAGAAGPGPAAGAGAAGAGAAAPAAAAPLPNYDELSIASLRARLRTLDVAQLRQLVEYEKAHAARSDVLAMFERRIAKLEAGA
jgi:hypothetical protein